MMVDLPLVYADNRCQGNMLLSFASTQRNPTAHLLSLLPKLTNNATGKDQDYFLGFVNKDNEIYRIVRILSGDPSRGGMALDMEESLTNGERVIVSTEVTWNVSLRMTNHIVLVSSSAPFRGLIIPSCF